MKIKVCGMKDKSNIDQLVGINPDYIGFIFHPRSKRYIGKIDEDILSAIPEEIKKVGVFVDEPIDSLIQKYFSNHLDVLQLHGYELPEYCEEMYKLNIPLIKSFRVNTGFDFGKTKAYESSCAYFLFDTAGQLAGGNGIKFDWSLLNNYKGDRPFFLSGGICAEDLTSILQLSHPRFGGIDLNSGFELEPGKKDLIKLGTFIREIRQQIQ